MLAIVICISVAGTIGWKMQGMIAKKQLSTSVERLKSRLLTCRRLAMNMQADWGAVLSQEKEGVFFRTFCTDSPEVKALSPLTFRDLDFLINGEKKEKISFAFTGTGDILPEGLLEIRKEKVGVLTIDLKDLFSVQGGRGPGPMHPDDW